MNESVRSNTPYILLVGHPLHSICTVGSAYLDSIECGDCIHLREAFREHARGERKGLATPCCNRGVHKELLEYIYYSRSLFNLTVTLAFTVTVKKERYH